MVREGGGFCLGRNLHPSTVEGPVLDEEKKSIVEFVFVIHESWASTEKKTKTKK